MSAIVILVLQGIEVGIVLDIVVVGFNGASALVVGINGWRLLPRSIL